ncbi:diacylglycerol kinase [Deinococcus arenae]|uniref:Diacylglycerol kinase n=2 Tax=Deinococcus arenae TaxID=1452751 RepID=A0A8H9GRF2_9DEIO|nr:diacylglycerol kinase [Deinococcus arenae]
MQDMALTPAVLIHNASAGTSHRAGLTQLGAALRDAGFDAEYRPTRTPADLLPALHGPLPGPVFIAGGDGTFRAAALHLAGRGATVGVIPLGTSNNIARTLGLTGDPLDIARAYRHAAPHPFDAGRVQAPWGEDVFFEAFGCGVFADVLHAYDPDAPKSPLRAAQALLSTLPGFQAQPVPTHVDGQDSPAPPLALLEIMNIQSTGNSLRLAPDAHPGDGQLNLIRVNGEQRDSLLAYAAALLRGQFDTLPSVQEDVAATFTLHATGQVFHVDGETRTDPGGPVHVQVWAGALHVLRPT